MRLFVALAISTEVRENLASLIRDLHTADSHPKWVNPDNLHVTLKFIGEVTPERVIEISDALAVVRTQRQVIAEFHGIGFFPDARRPSVVWVGIQPSEILCTLAAEVNRVLAIVTVPREEKSFVPHLTIARFRETRLSAELRDEIEKRKAREFGTLAANEFHLVGSKLKSSGAEYTTLRSFRFAPEDSKGSRPCS
jgi:RNA 2',3'-cyclic 3'-phosphodiesterase